MQTHPHGTVELASEIHPNRLYLTKQVAALINVSARTMEGWRKDGKGPKITRLPGGTVRYRGRDLAAFLDEGRP